MPDLQKCQVLTDRCSYSYWKPQALCTLKDLGNEQQCPREGFCTEILLYSGLVDKKDQISEATDMAYVFSCSCLREARLFDREAAV